MTEDQIKAAHLYLEDGGLGEVIGMAHVAAGCECLKVEMSTEVAMALCQLAAEALRRRALQ